MVTYPNCALLLEVARHRCTVGVVHDHGGLTTLNDVYRYCVCTAKREDLGLAAPHGSIANACTIARILLRANDSRVPWTSAILALDTREEGRKVVWVC